MPIIIHPIELSLYLRWVCEEFILGISNGNGLVFVLVLFSFWNYFGKELFCKILVLDKVGHIQL